MRRIAISNGKGGVGKTTTTANLGAALARQGKSVLLIDMDPQQSLTDFFALNVEAGGALTMKDVLLSDKFDPNDAIQNIAPNLDIIPNTEDIAAFEDVFSKIKSGYYSLRGVLDKIKKNYDYCLIDTPPSLNVFVTLSLVAANEVFIPLKANNVDLNATERFLGTLEAAREMNPNLKVTGVVFTMVKKSSKAQELFSKKIFEGHDFEACVFKTKIRDTVKLGISSTKGLDVFRYDPKGIGATDYNALAKEVVKWN